MTREEFDKLVREVEEGVGRNPTKLKWRVFWLAMIGYLGLLFWLLVIVAISAGCFTVMLWADTQGKIVCGILGAMILFGGGWAALKSMVVKLSLPQGRVVTRAEVPVLFAVLDDLQKQLRSVPFHQVILDEDCNAGVSQVPRLGLLGWSRNYLIIGLPLMDGLSPDEMRAVLAHEFAHLSRDHGRFTHWLYRLRRSWEVIFNQLSKPRTSGEITSRTFVKSFLDWFWPKFNAHAFVLSRSNEYEADEQSGIIAGKQTAASALVRIRFLGRQLGDNIWPDVWQIANERDIPPDDVFVRLRDGLRAGPDQVERSRWMEEAFLVKTTNSDTHPCLTDRLSALGVSTSGWKLEEVSIAATPSSAEVLLGDKLDVIRADVQKQWCKDTQKNWKDRHARANALSHRLTTLNQAVPNPGADADSLWDQAHVLLDLKGDKNLEPLLRQILSLRPDHAAANFYLGRLLLDAGNKEGETYLERLVQEDEGFLPQACAMLREHHRRAGRMDKVREVETRLDCYEKDAAASRKERSEFAASDTLIPHGLSDDELDKLRETLAADPQLARAELAQKQMKFFPKQKLFILCVHRWQAWHRLPNVDQDRVLVNRISKAVQLPGRVLVIPPSGSYSVLAKKFRHLPDTEIYRHAVMKR